MISILVCGDSHTKIFEYSNNRQEYFNFDVCLVRGATAQGSVNPNSSTHALNIFAKKIKESKKYSKIIIMLGEVDCGFLIWLRSKRYGISIDEQINLCVHNLFEFIEQIVIKNGYTNDEIIILGSVLPTIKDNIKCLVGTRNQITESQKVRTEKTLSYNSLLKKNCNKLNYHYVDITEDIIGDDGIVKDIFLHKNRGDHHLDEESTYVLWIDKLRSIIF